MKANATRPFAAGRPAVPLHGTLRVPGTFTDERRRPKVAPVPGLDDAEAEPEVAAEEAEEDVLEDTSDLEDGAEAIVDVEVEPETGEEER